MDTLTLLALDTSTEVLSIALESLNGTIAIKIDTGLRHNEVLMDGIRTLCELAGIGPGDLEAIICTNGPGSFTGLRIGMAAAKGIAAGAGIPLLSISSLELFSNLLPIEHTGALVSIIDAKMQKFYWDCLEEGSMLQGGPRDSKPEEIIADLNLRERKHCTFVGSRTDLRLLQEKFQELNIASSKHNFAALEDLQPAAQTLLRMGKRKYLAGDFDGIAVGPLYIRASQAEEAASKHGSPKKQDGSGF